MTPPDAQTLDIPRENAAVNLESRKAVLPQEQPSIERVLSEVRQIAFEATRNDNQKVTADSHILNIVKKTYPEVENFNDITPEMATKAFQEHAGREVEAAREKLKAGMSNVFGREAGSLDQAAREGMKQFLANGDKTLLNKVMGQGKDYLSQIIGNQVRI